jgi:hypothetical protein
MSFITLPRQHTSIVMSVLAALSIILILVGNRLRRQS